MDFNVFQFLSGKILQSTEAWADVPDAIAGVLIPMLAIALTITIMWQGYSIMRGAGGQDHLLDVFFNSMRVFLVVSLALTGGMYGGNVVALFHELREWLTGLFAGTTNSYAALDSTIATALENYKKIQEYSLQNIQIKMVGESNFTGVVTLMMGIAITGIIMIYCGVAAINLIIIDVSLALVIAIGPLFVAALAFNATSTFFNSWLSTVLKYIMTAILIAAVIGFANGLVNGFANVLTVDPATLDLVGVTAATTLGGGVLIFLASKTAVIGGEVIGSAGMQIASLARAVRAVANPAGAAAGAVMSGAGKVAGYAGGKAAGYLGAKAADSRLGQAVGSNRAMQRAMAPISAASHGLSGAGRAMSQRSIMEATRAGAQSGSSSARNAGLGGLSKG
ncbi:type IV secretion system protein [Pusillimonas sp.]|uniref:type IV secretion system protein n=1 Tax=Pusillimonas sp. TaxID=3040095 RepID=UPI0037CA71B1